MAEAKLSAAETDARAFIRVQGRATFLVAPTLREYGMGILDRGTRQIVFDLAECDGMDSTIMGVIAMIGLAARGKKAQIVVNNASDHNRKLLDDLGVSKVLSFARSASATPETVGLRAVHADNPGPEASGRTVLDAHEVLMNLETENIPKFRDVAELLHRELDSQTETKQTGDPES